MLTRSNYLEQTKGVNFSSNEALTQGHKFFTDFSQFYNDDDDVKKAIDNHIKAANAFMATKKTAKPKKAFTPKARGKKKESAPKPKKTFTPKARGKKAVQPKAKPADPKKAVQPKAKFKKGDYLSNKSGSVKGKVVSLKYLTENSITDTIGWHYEIENHSVMMFENNLIKTAKPKTPKAKKAVEPKTTNAPLLPGNFSGAIAEEVKIIKRFLTLTKKPNPVITYERFLTAINKKVADLAIRKKSPLADHIVYIQNGLTIGIKSATQNQNIKLDVATEKQNWLKKAVADADSTEALLVKRYANLFVGKWDKSKAENLLKAVEKIKPMGLFASHINTIKKQLSELLKGKTDVYPIATPLRGLGSTEMPKVSTFSQVAQAKYNTVDLPAKYKTLIGDFLMPSHIFIFGKGGSRKSTLSLLLGEALSNKGLKVMYVAGEQYGTPSFTTTINLLQIKGSPNYQVTGSLQNVNLNNFDVVVLDSKDSLGIEVETFTELKRRYPNVSFIITSQATKEGGFTGPEKWRNEVDCMIYCENGTAYTNRDKNRLGGRAEMVISK